MKARVMPRPPWASVRQQAQVQSVAMGEKSVAYATLRRFKVPLEVMALPNRYIDGV